MENRRRECISSACAFLCGTNKLKSEQHVLEKLQEKLINNLKSFTIQERNELLDYARLLESNINKDIAVIQDELFDVFDLLKKVTKEINDPEKLKQHDISYFRTKISELEKRIFTLHSDCTRELKKLNEEEIALTNELEAVEDVIESWATGTVRNTIKRVQSSSKIKCNCDGDNDNLTPEVKNFQKFLEHSGGHTGGWSEPDHLFYLNLRKKHNAEATATLFNQKCPDKSIERVLAHDAWQETYIQLKREQEKSIKEWRMNHKTKHVRTCHNYDGPKLDTKSSRNIDRDPELKTKLKIWKEHQKIKKEEEEEEKKQTELLKKKEEELKRQKQEKRRAFVNEYKLQKLSCEQAMEIARQVEEEKLRQQNAARANSLIRTFRDEDKKFALRMRERFQQQHDKKHYRKSSSSSESSIKVTRDPERLLKPTEVWRLKTAKKDDIVYEAPQPVLYVRDIPRLGIPKWRHEVSNTF